MIEEFGLTRRFYGEEEMKVVVAVVADALIASKRAGRPLMGAWLWQANPPGVCGALQGLLGLSPVLSAV